MSARRLFALALLPAFALAAAPSQYDPAYQVELFKETSRTPAFGGWAYEGVGPYEVVKGVVSLRINPAHPANKAIVDLDKAPPDKDGWVRYATELVVLRPVDLAKSSHVLLVDLPNKGNKLVLRMLDEAPLALDEKGRDGNAYLMRHGHTMAWIGWQGDIPLATATQVGMRLPVAMERGKPITGTSNQEIVFDNVQPVSTMALTWPAANLTQKATLTVRARADAEPVPVPVWRYTSPKEIEITRMPKFDAGAIYSFTYEARDPAVMGLGFAALRDVTSWLKAGRGAGHPLANFKPAVTVATGVSQSGRALKDFIWYGFNADTAGGKVFDGAMPMISGAKRSFTNARFAIPERNVTQHVDHASQGDQFPFSYGVTRDPLTGRTDGIFARCTVTRTCPKVIHADSSTEFWQGRASLLVSDGAGKDIALPPDARVYLLSSTQHIYADPPAPTGICKWPQNTVQQAPVLKALLEDLVLWARDGKAPPASAFPSIAEGKLVEPQAETVGFPDLAPFGVTFPTVINQLEAVGTKKQYQLLVPLVDADGHDISGVRVPDIELPLATYTGWNLRRPVFAENALCGLNGATIPLPATARTGDSRLALSQRYTTRLQYAKDVAQVARELRDRGLLLQEDVDRYIERAKVESRIAP